MEADVLWQGKSDISWMTGGALTLIFNFNIITNYREFTLTNLKSDE